MTAAAVAHQATGVTNHDALAPGLPERTRASRRSFAAHGVPLERVIIGHSGDSEDLVYLRELMDDGSTIGMDRFGMEHVLPDDRRVGIVLALLRLGYADRMVLSHDAAYFSHVTPPSWRAVQGSALANGDDPASHHADVAGRRGIRRRPRADAGRSIRGDCSSPHAGDRRSAGRTPMRCGGHEGGNAGAARARS